MASDELTKKRRDNICKLLKERKILSITELNSVLNISKIIVQRDLYYFKVIDKFKRLGNPDIISRIFEIRRTNSYIGIFQRNLSIERDNI